MSHPPVNSAKIENGHCGEDNIDPQTDRLISAIKEMSESELPTPVRDFLGALGLHVCSLSQNLSGLMSRFDQLSAQLSAVADFQTAKITAVEGKVSQLCRNFNLEMAPSGSTDGKEGDSSVSNKKTDEERVAVEDKIKESHPNIWVVTRFKDPLAFAYQAPLRIADLVFWCTEQALLYVKYRFMARPDLAACVKKTYEPSKLHNMEFLAESEEWNSVRKDALMALLQLRLEQCSEFKEKLQQIDHHHVVVFANGSPVFGTGCGRAAVTQFLPSQFPGENLYGLCLKELRVQMSGNRLSEKLPFEFEKYCTFEQVRLSVDREQVLVLGDFHLGIFVERLSTVLSVDPAMTAVYHPKHESHTAKYIFEQKHKEGVVDKCSAVVLLFGASEVGRQPDKIESDFAELLRCIRGRAPHVAVFVCSALPRKDKSQDQMKLANYAIGIATRGLQDPRIVFLDINEKFSKFLDVTPTFLDEDGQHLTHKGADKLADILAGELPFVSLELPPKKQISTPANVTSDGNKTNALVASTSQAQSTGVSPSVSAFEKELPPAVPLSKKARRKRQKKLSLSGAAVTDTPGLDATKIASSRNDSAKATGAPPPAKRLFSPNYRGSEPFGYGSSGVRGLSTGSYHSDMSRPSFAPSYTSSSTVRGSYSHWMSMATPASASMLRSYGGGFSGVQGTLGSQLNAQSSSVFGVAKSRFDY